MPQTVAPDRLSWVKPEIDFALKIVREGIAKFLASPENHDALKACPSQIHQVSGALNIVGLSGANRFCQAIEAALSGIGRGQTLGRHAVESIDQAVLALKEFIDDLSKGKPNAPMRLFPLYKDLAALQNNAGVSERDLFFPDLSRNAPGHPSGRLLPVEQLPEYLKTQRAKFQRGLLAWLRKPTDTQGLQEMRAALDALDQAAARLPQPRSQWWVAVGLVDCMLRTPHSDWTATANAICGKLDLRIRDIAAGSQETDDHLMREVLYAVGRCPAVTPRVRAVRELYHLESLFSEPTIPGLMEFDMDWLQPALEDARKRLEVIKNTWVQYVAGQPNTLPRFHQLAKELKTKVNELGNHQMARLLEVIALAPTWLPDPYPKQGQMMIMEMASAFLLAESILDEFTAPPADLEQQVTLIGGWVLDASKGKASAQPPEGVRADLIRQIGDLQVQTQVAKEIHANLQHIEQVLDAFARDVNKRATLPALASYLRQIHGALTMLGYPRAAEMVTTCEKLIVDCGIPGYADLVEDMNWIAEGLSSLGFFLDPCIRGGKPIEEAVELFFQRYEQRNKAPAAPAVEEPAPAAAAEPRPEEPLGELMPAPVAAAPETIATPTVEPEPLSSAPAEVAPSAEAAAAPVDPELLQVYLDEAQEVLASINEALALSRQRADDHEALVTIRRGFHTLKGSGRMVGLTDLGETAWEIEQVMNAWLEQGRPATPLLITLLDKASTSFSGWVGQLNARAPLQFDAREISALAGQARNEPLPAPAAIPEPLQPAAAAAPKDASAAPAQPAEISIGDVRLSRNLYDIYLKEAQQLLATLATQSERWRAHPGEPLQREFMRAAHTLASSSRTAGFSPVADLASAVEQWLPHARLTLPAGAGLVANAVARLKAMVSAIADRQPPADGEETKALLDLVQELQATEPPAPVASHIKLPAAPPPSAVPPAEERVEQTAAALLRAVPGDNTLIIRAAATREQRAIKDDLDAQLLPIFLEEARELLPSIGGDLRNWKDAPEDGQIPQSLQRALHTIKGSARMAGAMRLGELAHIMENRVEAALETGAPRKQLIDELESQMDRLGDGIERLQAGEAAAAPAAPPPGTVEPVESVAPEQPLAAGAAAMLRINADTLDWLVNESGEIGISRSRLENELNASQQSLRDLGDSIGRLRAQLREVEIQADSQMQSRQSVIEDRRDFDPLEFDRYTRLQELTRMMAEGLHDVTAIQQTLAKAIGEMDAALGQQARMNRELQQALMHIRTVPFSNLGERLYRVVRQAARDLDKKASLDIQGAQVELDRGVLERIAAPLEHMLRNAVAHGLEAPDARIAAGKPATGEIAIALRQESNEIVIVVRDDGAGLNLERLRAKGREKALLPDPEQARDGELMQLIFTPGFSTAEQVTEIAGRGVGMDVVKNEITAIGGRIDIASVPGKGATFTLYIPLTLAVAQAVLLRSAGAVYAVPSSMVEHVLRLKPDELAAAYARGTLATPGGPCPLRYLGHLLGTATGAAPLQSYNSVLLVRSGAQRLALHVDEMSGNREVVVKNIGPQLSRVPGVTGATVLGDGRIVLIINPVPLATREGPTQAGIPQAGAGRNEAKVVMVVDDSLTVRKVTGKLLEREGYRVLTAKDGLDALEQLKEALPSLMLVDIEMPRMDGFDLVRSIRADARTSAVPIMMISSRTAEKHRSHAIQLGANAFFGKPYQEAELLQQISRYTGKTVAERV